MSEPSPGPSLERPKRSNLARGAAYTVLSRVAFILSGYAIHISMAHLLTAPEYGALGVIVGLITLWRVFLSAGLPQTASQFIAGDEARAYGIWRGALRIQMLFALAIWILYVAGAPLWANLLNDPSLTTDILISSFMIPFMAWYQVNVGYYVGRLQFGWQAIYTTLYSVARVALAVLLALVGLRVHGAVLGMTLAVVVVAVLTHLGVPKAPGGQEGLPDWRRLVGFSLPLVVVSLGLSSILNLDLLILQRIMPDSDVTGYYSGAVNLGKSPYFLLASLATTALPSISKALQTGERDAARRLVTQHTSYVLLISLPCAALVAGSSAELMEFVYPTAYTVAALPLTILVFSMSGMALLSVLVAALIAASLPRPAMFIVLACVLIQCVLGVALVPKLGMVGTASANLLAVAFGLLACSWLVKRVFGAVTEFVRVLKAALISAVLGAALSRWHGYSELLLPVLYAAGLVLYALAMLALGAVTPKERAMLDKVLGRFRLRTAGR
jgi:O-antigen/teichoic acid export membrane protein